MRFGLFSSSACVQWISQLIHRTNFSLIVPRHRFSPRHISPVFKTRRKTTPFFSSALIEERLRSIRGKIKASELIKDRSFGSGESGPCFCHCKQFVIQLARSRGRVFASDEILLLGAFGSSVPAIDDEPSTFSRIPDWLALSHASFHFHRFPQSSFRRPLDRVDLLSSSYHSSKYCSGLGENISGIPLFEKRKLIVIYFIMYLWSNVFLCILFHGNEKAVFVVKNKIMWILD